MRTRAAWATAPKPVTTPQPSSAACHSGTSSGIGIAPAAATTAYSAKQATVRPCWRRPPSAPRRRELPSGRLPATDSRPTGSHSVRRPDRHGSHCAARGDHAEDDVIADRHIGDAVADGRTTPAPSWPRTIGHRPAPSNPSARWISEWQTPAAATLTSTSPARGGSSVTVSTAGGRPGSRRTQACMVRESLPGTRGVVSHRAGAVKAGGATVTAQTPNWARTASMRMSADPLGSRRRGWQSAIVRGMRISLGSSHVSDGSTAPAAPSRSRQAWP